MQAHLWLENQTSPRATTCRSHLTLINAQSHVLSNWKWMCKAPQGKEKSGAARKRGAYIFFCAAARRQPQKVRRRRQERAQMLKNLKIWHTENMHMSSFIHNILITSWTNDDSSWKLYWIAAFGTYEMFWSIWNQNYEQRWNDEITWKWKILNFARRAA